MTRKSAIRRRWMWAIALVVATSLLFVVFKNVDWTSVWQEVRRVQPLWLLAAVALNFAILLFWSLQWRVFLPRARRKRESTDP